MNQRSILQEICWICLKTENLAKIPRLSLFFGKILPQIGFHGKKKFRGALIFLCAPGGFQSRYGPGPGFESRWILCDLLLSVTSNDGYVMTINNHGQQEVQVRSLIKWLPPARNNESINDILMMQELLDYMYC